MDLLKPTLVALVLLGTLATVPAASAQDRPYTEGTVWDISYVRTEPGQFDAYAEELSTLWQRLMERAKEEGYVLSYKVLSAPPSNRDDWNLMLLIEYPNMAALDNADERFDPLVAEVIGSIDESNRATAERRRLREILGGKLARELVLR